MRILIPWDELSEEQQESWGSQGNYDGQHKACTTPIRMPDEWSEADWKEYRGWLGVGQSKINQEVAVKIFEIATRIPVDPWEEMDKHIKHITVEGSPVAEAWEKLKESRDE